MSDIESMFAVLDQEPWLTLSAWADQMADQGKTSEEKVIRWMITWRRTPNQRIVWKAGVPSMSYYWYPKIEGTPLTDERWKVMMKRSQRSPHMLPIIRSAYKYGSNVSEVLKDEYPTVSGAYRAAVRHLTRFAGNLPGKV